MACSLALLYRQYIGIVLVIPGRTGWSRISPSSRLLWRIVWMSSWPWTMGAQIWDPREKKPPPSYGKDDSTWCWAVLSEGEGTKRGVQAEQIQPSPSLDNLGISPAIPQQRSQSCDNRGQDNGGGQQRKISTIILFYHLCQVLNSPDLPCKQGGWSQILHDIHL